MKKTQLTLLVLSALCFSSVAIAQDNNGTESTTTTKPILDIVSTEAKFPGGNSLINKFIANNIKYPSKAIDEGIEGKVTLSFVIEKDGSIGNVKVINSVHTELDREAIRVIKSMPKWEPATANDKPIRSLYTIPINFKLSNQ